VFFGTTYPAPFAANTAGASYSPGTLEPNRTYYWKVVAKKSAGSAPSVTWVFKTQ
jgi:hypothetical protein